MESIKHIWKAPDMNGDFISFFAEKWESMYPFAGKSAIMQGGTCNRFIQKMHAGDAAEPGEECEGIR